MKKPIFRLFSLALLSVTFATAFVACDDKDDNPTEEPGQGDFTVNRDDLKGTIGNGQHVTLTDGTYKLTGKLIVANGGKLTIKAGVKIEATDLASSNDEIRYIAVGQGAQIFVEGTATNPVVMTATTNVPGSWGGLVLCGRAPINVGESASAEVSDLTYGGSDVNDNSGSIKYLRIEYSGYAYNAEKEFNGLSLFGVGSGTTIDYVQAYEGSDDGFEFFGGTVQANHLVVYNAAPEVGDDLFDWTQGWTGGGESWYGFRSNPGNRGIEADNNDSNEAATPISNPTIKNLTLVGGNNGEENQAIKLRVGTKAQFDNVVLKNWGTGFDVQAAPDLSSGYVGTELKATNVRFEDIATPANATAEGIYTENANATGAGSGADVPAWANGWTAGL